MNVYECWKFLKIRLFALSNKLFNQEFAIHETLSCLSCNQKDHNFLPLPPCALFILYLLPAFTPFPLYSHFYFSFFCSAILGGSLFRHPPKHTLFCWAQPLMVAIPFVFYLLSIRVSKKYDKSLSKQVVFFLLLRAFCDIPVWSPKHIKWSHKFRIIYIEPSPKRKEWREKAFFPLTACWHGPDSYLPAGWRIELYRERFEQRKLRSNLVLWQGPQT